MGPLNEAPATTKYSGVCGHSFFRERKREIWTAIVIVAHHARRDPCCPQRTTITPAWLTLAASSAGVGLQQLLLMLMLLPPMAKYFLAVLCGILYAFFRGLPVSVPFLFFFNLFISPKGVRCIAHHTALPNISHHPIGSVVYTLHRSQPAVQPNKPDCRIQTTRKKVRGPGPWSVFLYLSGSYTFLAAAEDSCRVRSGSKPRQLKITGRMNETTVCLAHVHGWI